MAKMKKPAGARAPQQLGREASRQAPADLEDDDEDDDTPGQSLADLAAGAGDEVEEILDQLGAQASSARIIIHRITANQDPEECIDCPLQTFSKEQLRSQFGAGQYSCEVRNKGQIKRRWLWRFAAPIAPSSSSAAVDSRADRLEAELRAEREKSAQRQHEMLLAAMQRPQAEGHSLGELLETLTSAKALLGGAAAAVSPIAQIKEILEVRDLLGDGGGKGANGMDLALKALESLPHFLQAGADKPARAPRRLAGPSPGADKMSAVRPGAEADTRSQVLALLLQHAEQGSDPAAVAQFIYGQLCELEQGQFDTVCAFLEGEGALSLVMMIEPRLKPAQEWLGKVLEQLRAVISQGDSEPDLPTG
jgi:hypothetical protein